MTAALYYDDTFFPHWFYEKQDGHYKGMSAHFNRQTFFFQFSILKNLEFLEWYKSHLQIFNDIFFSEFKYV